MQFVHFISLYVSEHLVWAYLIILLGIIIEGELILLVLGVFAHTHVIPLSHGLTLAVFGATIKTILGYLIGVWIKTHVPQNKVFDFIEKRVLVTFPNFQEKPFWSLFFSKFIYGLNHFTIIFAGYVRVKWKTYVTTEAISSAAWIAIMFFIGYFFSYTAFGLSKDIRKVGLMLLLGIIAFLLISRVVNIIIEFIESEN